MSETELDKMRGALFQSISANGRLRDQFIGTLMLLAFDGCISEGRARELAQIDIYKWREELNRILQNQEPQS